MFNLLEHFDFYTKMNECNDLQSMEKVIFEEFAKHEVSSLYLGYLSSVLKIEPNDFTKDVYSMSNHPDKWFDQLGIDKVLDNDLTAYLVATTKETIIWHDNSLWDEATNEEKDQAIFENELGMKAGITFSLSGGQQNNNSMIGLSMSGVNVNDFELYWAEKKKIVTEICELANLMIQQKYMPEMCKKLNLKPRHLDYMKFRMEGFSNKEIAHKMGCSHANIYQIAGILKSKFNARSTTHAIFIANSLNLVEL